MKATGIVRRIDDLGRVVIPKEIRRTLKIREGEQLEIFTGKDSEVILKKYSALGDFGKSSNELCISVGTVMNKTICLVDKDQIVATSIEKDDVLKGKSISQDLEKAINNRKLIISKKGEIGFIKITDNLEKNNFISQIIKPIISDGDPIGAVIILSDEEELNEIDEKIANMIALFYEKQLEA